MSTCPFIPKAYEREDISRHGSYLPLASALDGATYFGQMGLHTTTGSVEMATAQ